jgi:hypothetical protein
MEEPVKPYAAYPELLESHHLVAETVICMLNDGKVRYAARP